MAAGGNRTADGTEDEAIFAGLQEHMPLERASGSRDGAIEEVNGVAAEAASRSSGDSGVT